MNWQTGIPKLNRTSGKSNLLLCKAVYDGWVFPILAFYNNNTKEWIEANKKPVKGDIIGWQIIEL